MKRYVLQAESSEIEETFNVQVNGESIEKNFNVKPGSEMPIIIEKEGKRQIIKATWGLPGDGEKVYAVKQEDVLENPDFKKLAQHSPCIIPASGFYKWKKTVEDPLPFYLRVLTQQVLPLAGLYTFSKNKKGDLEYAFVLITMQANALVEPLDKSMPCILEEKDFSDWLGKGSIKKLEKGFNGQSLLPNMAVYRVPDLVNDPNNNSQELIQPIPKLRDDDD